MNSRGSTPPTCWSCTNASGRIRLRRPGHAEGVRNLVASVGRHGGGLAAGGPARADAGTDISHGHRQDCRRREPRGLHPAIRASGGPHRPARLGADRRSVAVARGPRHHRRRSQAPARLARGRTGRRVVCQRLRRDRTAPPRLLFDDRVRLRARVRAGGARLAPPRRRVRPIPPAGGRGLGGRRARSAEPGRGVRALSAPDVSRQDALLGRGARHARADPRRDHLRVGRRGHAVRAARHGAPRTAERAGPRARQAVRGDPRRVQGSDRGRLVSHRPGLDGRRQVSRGRAHGRAARADVRHAGAESQPPRSRRPRGGRDGAGRRHRGGRPGRGALRRPDHAADPHSRRRGVSGAGRGRGNAEPVAAGRLRHRRDDPHHREQPARVHRHARGVVQHQLRERPRARIQDPDRARERRRSGRVPRGRQAGVGVSRALRPRFPDRSRRLPPLRPQRRRRAVVHAARDLSDRGLAPDRPRALGADTGREGHDRRRCAAGARQEALRRAGNDVRVAEAGAGVPRAGAAAAAAGRRREGVHGRAAGSAAGHQRRAAGSPRRLHVPSQAGTRARTAQGGAREPVGSHPSTGRRRRSWRWRRSSPTASPSA